MAGESPFSRGRAAAKSSAFAKLALPVLAGVWMTLAVSCKVGPDYTTPRASVAGQWTGLPASAGDAAEVYWWRHFNDPVLDSLIRSACAHNLSLQAAGVRVLETRAKLNKTIGNLFPQQQAVSGQLNYSRLNDGTLTGLPGVDRDYFQDEALFAATWEIDFWGKYRRSIESDRATFLGSVAAYDDAMVTLIADVASTYVNIRTLQERLEVAERNLQTQTEGLRIATAQFKSGETSELDVQQATTQLAQTESQVPLLHEALTQNKNGLAVLLGERPDEIDRHLTGPARIPATPAGVVAGIPRDLLRRRPDVREAGLQAASYSALIGVAKAGLYPSFSLSGEFGFSSSNEGNHSLSDLFSWPSRALSAGAGLVMPVFNYGRLVNQVRVQDAQFQQAVLNYQNTVLAAQQEVENGIASFANERKALVSLNRAAGSSRRAAELAMIQYKGGQTDYTTVLTAEQAELSVENSVAVTKGNVALGLIAIYRALGGGWEVRGGRDVIPDPVKEEMAKRTDWGKLLEPSRHLPKPPPATDAPKAGKPR